ncbi:hypothetical protein ABH931_004511 [Streptacidiphilus sp. MAP12-33]|uniref:hypothetical protein n=1 Tax=Streptacidiphilus sp. MAP12-33 TaxID=3156266 RepID=UPI0035133A9B
MPDEQTAGTVALAVALRDAHFRLKHLARTWGEQVPPGTRVGYEALGPAWSYGESPDEASYLDGHAVHYGATALVLELLIQFLAAGTDLSLAVHTSNADGDGSQLLLTGPLEHPATARELAAELDRCLLRAERLDPAPTRG